MLIDRKEIYSGRVIQVSVDDVQLPTGVRVPLEIVRHPGGAAAVALDEAGRVCLLRQFRHAAGGYIYELPAGKLEPDEPPETTARRELIEEASTAATHFERSRRVIGGKTRSCWGNITPRWWPGWTRCMPPSRIRRPWRPVGATRQRGPAASSRARSAGASGPFEWVD